MILNYFWSALLGVL